MKRSATIRATGPTRPAAARFAAAVFFALAACSSDNQNAGADSALDEELDRAVSYGIVTADQLADADGTIIHAQFCEMLTAVVAMRDESLAQGDWWEGRSMDYDLFPD